MKETQKGNLHHKADSYSAITNLARDKTHDPTYAIYRVRALTVIPEPDSPFPYIIC